MKTFFGDIHTHTTYSDGNHDPEFTIARAHHSALDFYAISDHSQCPDPPGSGIMHTWGEIVQPLGKQWTNMQKLIRDHHEPGRFVTFLGHEWSSVHWGHHNVYFLRDDEPIRYARSLAELYAKLEGVPAMIIPHHTGYPPHHCGYDWVGFDPRREPLVEIFSHHGLSEASPGPDAFHGAVMGPRCRSGAVRRALNLGHIFGFMSSSDDHTGWPGSHDMGLTAVQAEELTREALWDAFWNRRTYAVTGDRMLLNFQMNGEPMGRVLRIPAGQSRRLVFDVEGWDCLQSVEIVKNGETVKTWTDFAARRPSETGAFKVGLEWGYHLEKPRDWNIKAIVEGGTLTGANFHFGEPGNDSWRLEGPSKLTIASKTNHYGAVGKGMGHQGRDYGSIKHIDLAIEGSLATRIDILLDDRLVLSSPIGSLLEGDQVRYPFGAFMGAIHLICATPRAHYASHLEWEDEPPGAKRDYHYMRVVQRNGQMGWTSPIWSSAA